MFDKFIEFSFSPVDPKIAAFILGIGIGFILGMYVTGKLLTILERKSDGKKNV
jgi:hypothetical protein